MSLKTYHKDTGIGPVIITPDPNQTWQVLTGHIFLTSSATGGNRKLHVTAKSADGDPVWDIHSAANQGPSQLREYHIRTGEGREGAFVDNDIIVTIPRFALITSGMYLEIDDSNAIDVSNDTYKVHLALWVVNSFNPRPDQIL